MTDTISVPISVPIPEPTPVPLQASTTALLHPNLLHYACYPQVAYEPRSGLFCRINKDSSLGDILELRDNNMLGVTYVDPISGKRKSTNRKAAMLAWEFINQKPWPKDHCLLFKDLCPDNLSAFNITLIPKDQYQQIKDAVDNLNGTLRIQPDQREAYKYKVRYKIKGLTSYKYFWDITEANRFKKLVLIKSTRVLNRFLPSE